MYAKVFSQIFDSSIADDYPLRHFFMDMLVLADSDGVVDMTPSAISSRTRIPIQSVQSFLEKLESPDPESRTPTDEGRRLKRLDDHRSWGWLIVNYDKFREIGTEMQRREATKLRVQKHREKIRCNASVTPCNADVTPPYASASVVPSESVPVGGRGLEKEVHVEQAPLPISVPVPRFKPPTDEEAKLQGAKIGLPDSEVQRFLAYYGSNGWRVGKNPMKNWVMAMSGWKVRWEENNGGFKPNGAKHISGADIRMAIQSKEERAKQLKDRYSSEGPITTDWSDPSKKSEYVQLKKEIKELKLKAEQLVTP